MKRIILSLLFSTLSFTFTFAQITITPSGITPLQGGGSGAIDRLTTSARIALTGQISGKMVFDLDKGYLYVWDGFGWNRILQDKPDQISSIEAGASDAANADRFGHAVAIKGEWAVVGAPGVDSQEGEAYVFRKGANGWQHVKRLRQDITGANSAISAGAKFGFSVDIDIITYTAMSNGFIVTVSVPIIVVGAPEQGTGGRAFVFRYPPTNDWLFDATLNQESPAAGDDFGHSVSISNRTIAVGAPYDDVVVGGISKSDAGSVTTFQNANSSNAPSASWTKHIPIAGSPTLYDGATPNPDNYFGWSVALDGSNLAIGVPLEDTDDSGKVVLYSGNPSWSLIKTYNKNNLNNIAAGSQVGYSVALSGQNLLIGAPYDNITSVPGGSNIPGAGTAHLVHCNTATWLSNSSVVFSKIFNPSNANVALSSNANWGTAVSIAGDYLMIGAPLQDVSQASGVISDIGFARAYKYTAADFPSGNHAGGGLIKIQEPKRSAGFNFGRGVAISSEGTFLVGEAKSANDWPGKVHFGDVTGF